MNSNDQNTSFTKYVNKCINNLFVYIIVVQEFVVSFFGLIYIIKYLIG